MEIPNLELKTWQWSRGRSKIEKKWKTPKTQEQEKQEQKLKNFNKKDPKKISRDQSRPKQAL